MNAADRHDIRWLCSPKLVRADGHHSHPIEHRGLVKDGPLSCEDAADANDDGHIDVSDAVTLLNALFGQSSSIRLSNQMVTDATPDALGCAQY